MNRLRRTPPPAAAGARAPWGWAIAGALLGLLLVLLVWAPARWLAAGLERATGGMVQLADPQGTVWDGSATLSLTAGQGSQGATVLPGRLHWRLRPGAGRFAVQAHTDCCTPRGPVALTLAPRWGGAEITAHDGQIVLPAAMLAGLGTPWNTLQPEGELQLATQGLSASWLQGRLQVDGRAELTLRNLASRLSQVRPLGSYRVLVVGGDAVNLTLSTLEGALQLTGNGRWVGGRLHFSGEARAAPGMEAQLANLLNLIGRRQGDRSIMNL